MLRRSRARFFGVLALAAIAMQMVLSFAHTHVGASQVAGLDAASVRCLDSTGTSCPAPADHDGPEATCAICLAANQAAATALFAPPGIAPPEFTALARYPVRYAPAHTGTGVAYFYARGPPAA